MRYILALIIAVPLLAVSLEADAGLVEDLRSGKSNVRAEIELSPWGKEMYRKYMHGLKSNPDYKAFVTYRGGDWIQGWSGSASAEQAIKESLKYCKEKRPTGAQCRVYAVGHTVVAGYSQAELADAIEAYQLEVSGSKSTKPRDVHCKREDGSIYSAYRSCGQNIETTKSEYDLLQSRRSAYCQKDDASVFVGSQLSLDEPCGPHTQITKWVYERLKEEKREQERVTKDKREQERIAREKREAEKDEVVSASSGSGFAVSSDGHVITNNHVIDGCQRVQIHHKGKSIPATIVTFDPNNDLALLQGDFRPSTVFTLSKEKPELLQDIYVAGYPFGQKISTSVKVTKGIISSLTGIGNNFSNF